jgi:formylglycine-generating enzyme required for sulfatase activity
MSLEKFSQAEFVRLSKMRSLTVPASVLFLVYALGTFAVGARDEHHTVGQSFRDCNASCAEMVLIPAGKFTIGSSPSERGRGSDENPQQQVTIAYTLAVGKYPVTPASLLF